MHPLEEMAIFAAVVESRSFTGAARKLGLPKSTVSHKVSQLEKRLGARLLQRSTRSQSLTEMGRPYYEACRQMLEKADEAQAAIEEIHPEPKGKLRMAAPYSVALLYAETIAGFAARYPEVCYELDLGTQDQDPVEVGYDLVFRFGPLRESGLVARKFHHTRPVLVASPHYLERNGIPRRVSRLAEHLGIIALPWEFSGPGGVYVADIPVRIQVSDLVMAKELARKGLGIARLPFGICFEDILAGTLQPLRLDHACVGRTIYMLYPSRQYLPTTVRAFVDWVLEHPYQPPSWDIVTERWAGQ